MTFDTIRADAWTLVQEYALMTGSLSFQIVHPKTRGI